jgi:polyadenylate-binding protein
LLTHIVPQPKLTITLLDQEDLRSLAHLMNSYPTVMKEKALLVQAAKAAK